MTMIHVGSTHHHTPGCSAVNTRLMLAALEQDAGNRLPGLISIGPKVMPPPSVRSTLRSSAGERAVYLRTNDAHAFYGQPGFLPAVETVMQRPRPVSG